MSEDPYRIVIADDHPIFREGIRDVLAAARGMEVVGEAATAEEAVDVTLAQRPSIVLMDIRMPSKDHERPTFSGLDAIGQIVDKAPETAVLVLTDHDDPELAVKALQAGASGYWSKQSPGPELVAAIRVVVGGGLAISSSVAASVRDTLCRAPDDAQALPGLSKRELEIVGLVAAGKSNGEIARLLSLSRKTIANQLSVIYSKLGVSNRTQLASLAHQKGIGRE